MKAFVIAAIAAAAHAQYTASFQQMGDCYDTSEFTNPNGTFGTGGDCVLDCAAQGSYVANWSISSGYCYCEYMEFGEQCESVGAQDWYELWQVEAGVQLQQMGDCYDTSEFTNANSPQASGGDCVADCAAQGSYLANWSIGSGWCYCEMTEMGHQCEDVGSTDYYELWEYLDISWFNSQDDGEEYGGEAGFAGGEGVFQRMGDCYDTSEWFNQNSPAPSGAACVEDCAAQGSFLANWDFEYGYCYCEDVGEGHVCEDFGSEDWYELWEFVSAGNEGDDGDDGDCSGTAAQFEFYGAGDCYDTSEWFNNNAPFESGLDCIADCWDQGSGLANYSEDSGYCWCEDVGAGYVCETSGGADYYNLYRANF